MRHAFLLDLALERLSHLLDVALLVDLNGQVQVVPRTELKFSSKIIKILKNGGHGNFDPGNAVGQTCRTKTFLDPIFDRQRITLLTQSDV